MRGNDEPGPDGREVRGVALAGVRRLRALVAGLVWSGVTRFGSYRNDRGSVRRPIRADAGVGPFYHPEDEPARRVPAGTTVHHPLLDAVRKGWVARRRRLPDPRGRLEGKDGRPLRFRQA